jgi:hypothetical protein
MELLERQRRFGRGVVVSFRQDARRGLDQQLAQARGQPIDPGAQRRVGGPRIVEHTAPRVQAELGRQIAAPAIDQVVRLSVPRMTWERSLPAANSVSAT